MREIGSESTVFNQQLRQMGINITDADGNFRDFVTIMKEVAAKTKEIRAQFGDEGVIAFQGMFGLDANAARAFLGVVNNAEKLDDLIAGAQKRGTADQLFKAINAESAASAIKRIQASVNSLYTDFVIGLLPIMKEVTDTFQELAGDKDLQEFFRDFGKALSEEVLPILKLGLAMFKKFMKILKENKGLMKTFAQTVVFLTATLIGLFVVGTVGALFTLAASSLLRLGGV